MKSEKLILIWTTVPLLAGCFTRQAVYRVDYVPAPPPKATAAGADPTQVVVIEEPPPPEPAPSEAAPPASAPSEAARPAPTAVPTRHNRAAPAPAQEPSSEPVEPAKPEESQVPQLEPGETSASQSADLHRQIDNVQSLIGTLDRAQLSAASLKDLDDATNFVKQSEQALEAGDRQRSSTLVHKALLLVEAVEKQR